MNEKKAIKVKMGKTWEMFNGGYLEGVGQRKGKGEHVILFQLKNKNARIYYSCGGHSGLLPAEMFGKPFQTQ